MSTDSCPLPAYLKGTQVVVWCESDRGWHFHGTDPSGDPEKSGGHRVAHCLNPASPYQETGYVLRYAGRFEDLPPEVQRPRQRRWRFPRGR